jgi:hypothetical protein
VADQTRLAVPRTRRPLGQRTSSANDYERENSGYDRAPSGIPEGACENALFLARRSSRICPYFGSLAGSRAAELLAQFLPFVIGFDRRLLTLKRKCLGTTSSASNARGPSDRFARTGRNAVTRHINS